jgi:RNA polymerase sigma-70 factor (ECF subfamily)
MSASLASSLRADFEPRSSIQPRPHLALVLPAPALPAPAAEPVQEQPAVEAAPSAAKRAPTQGELLALMPGLRRRALRWCRDAARADDLVQETLLRACRHGGKFENEGHLQAWAHTVLHNLLVSRGRRDRSARRALGVLGATLAEGVSGWSAPAPSFLLPSLERALDSLPEPFGSTLRLVDLEEHSYAEAAALLGVPVGTVMSRLFRGRRRLAQALLAAEGAGA